MFKTPCSLRQNAELTTITKTFKRKKDVQNPQNATSSYFLAPPLYFLSTFSLDASKTTFFLVPICIAHLKGARVQCMNL